MMEIQTSTLPGHGLLPLVVEPTGGESPSSHVLAEYINAHRDWLNLQLHINGGVLFRGFALREVAEFQLVARAILPQLLPYVEGQSPRTKVIDNVYTSTEFPPQYTITPHNELSYTKSPPPRIVFHCHIAPGEGGETPIFDFRKVYAEMDSRLRSRFEQAGVKYVKNMHGQERGLGKSWMEHFETSDRNVVEGYLHENDIDFAWSNDGTLKTWSIRPATLQHPVTGEWHWFNQANLWHVTNIDERHRAQLLARVGEENLPTHAYYGDGGKIADEDLDLVRQIMWDNAVIFPWQQGDVLVLDNFLVAHGRMPFKGPRKILVAMG
ncbi:MAG: TauD/TfdA family dioxygenase [Planctomycetes bacterium]|nr:TauD/TfdA family dioxygenase [Planctomycetota bacterium]